LTIDLPAFINIALFASIVGAAVIYMASMARKQSHSETAELASTRGSRIEDLEDEIKDLREHVSRLEGQVELVLSQKFDELADGIAVKIAEILEP
jgi:predicted nuclease with TOPRIM domain